MKKCHCLRIGQRFNKNCVALNINGTIIIEWVDEIDYLGVKIYSDNKLSFNWKDAKSQFYVCLNSIFDRLGCDASISILLKLIFCQAVPKLIYGVSATGLSKSDMKSFEYAYNRIFNKIFKSFDKVVISNCQIFCNYLNFECLYELHRLRFVKRIFEFKTF